jgi:hypothetical protein
MSVYLYKDLLPDTTKQKELIDQLIAENNIEPLDLSNKSTVHGVQYDLFAYIDRFDKVVAQIQKTIFKFLRVETAPVSAWTVLGEEGGYHTCHKHNDNDDISTVLYLAVPEETNDKQGAIYFFAENYLTVHIPKPGELLIFPVTMHHGTYPQGKGLRQTLNIDFKRLK